MKIFRILLPFLFLFSLFNPFYLQSVHAAPTRDDEIRPGVLLVGFRSKSALISALPNGNGLMSVPDDGLSTLNVLRVNVPVGQEEQYRLEWLSNPDVIYAEPDYRVKADMEPDDPRFISQYSLPAIQAPLAWDTTTGSRDVVLAVIDSGIDLGHPEFSGRLIPGYDFVDRDSTPSDSCGHGTHVAGIAAATGNNRRGIAGVDWNARIMPVRVLDRTCEGWISDVVSGLVWATDHGARVINLSLGTASNSTLLESGTYYAYQKGVVLVAAGGNAGISSLYYPARYPWVMAVGAVTQSNTRASFSNQSNRIEDMMVMAPGVGVVSTTPRSAFYYQEVFGTTREYGFLSGTSMASPHVAGAAALLLSQPGFDTPDKVYEGLYRTTLDLNTTGWDTQTGYGLIQIAAALKFTDFTPPLPVPEVNVDYDYASSKDCNQVTYNWVDIQSPENALPVFGRDGWARLDLPFDFPFAGQGYSTVAVSANGYISFLISSTLNSEGENFLIPGIATPNQFIAPFWDDLNPSAGGLIYGAAVGPDTYVIEWWSVPRQGYTVATSELTFELVLTRSSGEIRFQYQTLRGPMAEGSSATIGLEYGNGTAGNQYSYNRPGALQETQAIVFIPVDQGVPGSALVVYLPPRTNILAVTRCRPGVPIFLAG